MSWLNYHHLFYFRTVVRTGGVSAAARQLRLSQPTITGQIRRLEEALGEKLLERSGRGVVPTEAGRLVFRYADEIAALGGELREALRGRPISRAGRLAVGVTDAVPKLVAERVLAPALAMPTPIRILCRGDSSEALLSGLVGTELDLVLSDTPVAPGSRMRLFSHLLGESDVTWFAPAREAPRLRRGFPHTLDGAPVLLPTGETPLRVALDRWLEGLGLRPRPVAEIAESALLEAFGHAGAGLFAMPTVVAAEAERRYRVRAIGRMPEVRQKFYAISIERRLRNPAVVAIAQRARGGLFA